jgi:hypothetical protein
MTCDYPFLPPANLSCLSAAARRGIGREGKIGNLLLY